MCAPGRLMAETVSGATAENGRHPPALAAQRERADGEHAAMDPTKPARGDSIDTVRFAQPQPSSWASDTTPCWRAR